MADLYRRLAAGGDPAVALRQATMSLLHSETAFRQPYCWAPFVIDTSRLGGHAR
jgi:CHAT domain-containing protein